MKVCIVGASGKLGRYMVQHALDRGYEVVGVCRERSVGKLDAFKGRITIIPGATNDREVIKKAVAGCDGVLTVLVPWGVQQYSSGTAQAVLDYARPGARLVFSCGWHITRDGQDVYSRKLEDAREGLRLARPAYSASCEIDDQVEACRRVFASDTRWTVVRGSDLEEGESQGLPVWSRHVGDPILESNLTRRVDFALFMVAALENDELIHEAPAIVGCRTPSALAHDDPRHAVAPDRRHPPRLHLVQVHVHPARALGPPALPRARRADPHDLPLQQPDVYGGRPGRGGVERADVGEVRPGPDLRPAGHVALHPDHRRQPQGTGAGRAVLRAPRQHRALPAALLHGGGRHRARRGHQLVRAGPLPMGHRAAQRRQGRWHAGDPGRRAPRHDDTVVRHAERRAREPRMGREPEPVLRHGPLDVVVPGPPAGAPWRGPAQDSTRRSRSCPTTASA